MKKAFVLAAPLCLASCSTVGGYLNGQYNSEVFPPLNSPAETVALVSRSTLDKPENVLVSVDDNPIKVNPNGSGHGMWAPQVAIPPGKHLIMAGWRRPGMYSPAGWECEGDFIAGHQYSIEYVIDSNGSTSDSWISDLNDKNMHIACVPYVTPSRKWGWPFNPA
jgi:hypothetical protein